MEDLSKVSDSDLKSRQKVLEEKLNELRSMSYKELISVMDVVENGKGDFEIFSKEKIEFIPLADIIDPTDNHKVFDEGTLKLFIKKYHEYKDLEFRLYLIKQELNYRVTGDPILIPPHPKSLRELEPILNRISTTEENPKEFLDNLFEGIFFNKYFIKKDLKIDNSAIAIEQKLELDDAKFSTENQTNTSKNRMSKEDIFKVFANIPDIQLKLSKKERKGAQIWKLTEGMVWNKFSKSYPNKANESTIKRYLREYRSKLKK